MCKLCSHLHLCDYEYIQLCRKFSTDVKLVLANKKQTKSACDRPKTAINYKDMCTNLEVVSQKEINDLLGSFYTTEQRFRSVITAKDVVVCFWFSKCKCTTNVNYTCILTGFL